MESLMVHILRLWNGNQSLAVAFWMIYVPIMALHLFLRQWEIDSFFVAIIHASFFMLAWAFSLVAIWRCAPNVSNKNLPFPILAKTLVIVNLLPLILIIFVGLFGLFT